MELDPTQAFNVIEDFKGMAVERREWSLLLEVIPVDIGEKYHLVSCTNKAHDGIKEVFH